MARALEGSVVLVGGQDCHAAESGAHTGDISAEMLADAGARLVIVVTGKGGRSGGGSSGWIDEPGVLRRLVPHWLREPDMRAIVLGFEDAETLERLEELWNQLQWRYTDFLDSNLYQHLRFMWYIAIVYVEVCARAGGAAL